MKINENQIYIQFSFDLTTKEKMKQKSKSLIHIKDSFKYLRCNVTIFTNNDVRHNYWYVEYIENRMFSIKCGLFLKKGFVSRIWYHFLDYYSKSWHFD